VITTFLVKVKLSLCLTKHHAMKTYWGIGSIAPRILDLSTRWRAPAAKNHVGRMSEDRMPRISWACIFEGQKGRGSPRRL